MTHSEILQRIKLSGIVPAVRTTPPEHALRAVDAIAAGGITTLELPLTIPRALDVIRKLSASRSDLVIGAGTVLDEMSARMAILAGARFIVTPALNVDVITCCRRYGIPVIPGALTPTEILSAWQAGADVVKVFPASAMGGASYIKAVLAPLPQVELMPMGGVSIETAAAYLVAGSVALGVGADLVSAHALDNDDLQSITTKAREYVDIVRAHREQGLPRSVSKS